MLKWRKGETFTVKLFYDRARALTTVQNLIRTGADDLVFSRVDFEGFDERGPIEGPKGGHQRGHKKEPA
jgi:hypothetical protein